MSSNDLSPEKLSLLIFGYSRQSLGVQTEIPTEIFELIQLWQTRHPNLKIQFIRNFHSFLLEIHLDSRAPKLLDIHS